MPISRTAESVRVRILLIFIGLLAGPLSGEESNWPSFRGQNAAGVSEGLNLPDKWDAETGEGIRFKVEILGLDGTIYLRSSRHLFAVGK